MAVIDDVRGVLGMVSVVVYVVNARNSITVYVNINIPVLWSGIS